MMTFMVVLNFVITFLLMVRILVLEEKFKELTKYLGVEQLFED